MKKLKINEMKDQLRHPPPPHASEACRRRGRRERGGHSDRESLSPLFVIYLLLCHRLSFHLLSCARPPPPALTIDCVFMRVTKSRPLFV